MPAVDYLPFATSVGANVITQSAYAALPAQGVGFSSGTASSAQLNKVWRQSSMMSAALANMIANVAAVNVYDDGNLSGLTTNLTNAVSGAAVVAKNTSANGYMTLANGQLLIQWGFLTTSGTSGGDIVNFPTAFPATCLHLTTANAGASSGSIALYSTAGLVLSQTQFKVWGGIPTTGGGSSSFYATNVVWLAVGY